MLALIVSILVALTDQATKQLVRWHFALGQSDPVIPGFFNLTYVRNTGAAWGLLGGQNASLTVISLAMLLAMVVFRRSFLSDTWEHRAALGLMIGGIVGNLLDRVRLGWVTDFLDFHVAGHHWPSFNVADSAICAGVGIYVLSSIWVAGHPLSESRRRPPSGPAANAQAEDAPH